MSFEWSAYADLAERLIEVRDDFENDEACARTAISRCYYAAFGKAREDLEARGLMPSTANVHKGVQLAYDRGADKREKYIGRLLGGLRDHRRQADYESAPREPLDTNLANMVHGLAAQALEELAALDSQNGDSAGEQ